jgi:hypothetical protein
MKGVHREGVQVIISIPFEQFPCTCGSLRTRNKPEPGK